MFSNSLVHLNHLGSSAGTPVAGPHAHISVSGMAWVWDPRICISSNSQTMLMLPVQGPCFENQAPGLVLKLGARWTLLGSFFGKNLMQMSRS